MAVFGQKPLENSVFLSKNTKNGLFSRKFAPFVVAPNEDCEQKEAKKKAKNLNYQGEIKQYSRVRIRTSILHFSFCILHFFPDGEKPLGHFFAKPNEHDHAEQPHHASLQAKKIYETRPIH